MKEVTETLLQIDNIMFKLVQELLQVYALVVISWIYVLQMYIFISVQC